MARVTEGAMQTLASDETTWHDPERATLLGWIREASLARAARLGTRFTMEESFYRERMAMNGVETVVPDADERRIVNDVMYDELVLGIVREQSRAQYRALIERLVRAGARGRDPGMYGDRAADISGRRAGAGLCVDRPAHPSGRDFPSAAEMRARPPGVTAGLRDDLTSECEARGSRRIGSFLQALRRSAATDDAGAPECR
jgi:hypothetical protein